MSHNENRSRATQSTANSVTNLNVQDNEGVTIVGDGNSTTVTDYGAINAALDIGVEALRMGQTNLDTAAGLAGRGLDTALDATRSALDFSADSVRASENVARDAISTVSDFGGVALGEALSFARDLVEGAGSQVSELARSHFDGLSSLSQQTSQSSDDRVAKIAMYALVAVAAVFIVPKIFGNAS